jgi:hypothetical protein
MQPITSQSRYIQNMLQQQQQLSQNLGSVITGAKTDRLYFTFNSLRVRFLFVPLTPASRSQSKAKVQSVTEAVISVRAAAQCACSRALSVSLSSPILVQNRFRPSPVSPTVLLTATASRAATGLLQNGERK